MAGFDSVYDGKYIDGEWKAGLLLNGDNIMINYDLANEAILDRSGTGAKPGNEPCIYQVKLYRYE